MKICIDKSTWKIVSLYGEFFFHNLIASGTLRLDQATYFFFRILCLYMYLSQHFGKQQINKVNSYAKKINQSLAFYEIINLLRHYKL